MRSEWEEKAYIKPLSSSGSPTRETDTEQEQQTDQRASLQFLHLLLPAVSLLKFGFEELTHLVKNFV